MRSIAGALVSPVNRATREDGPEQIGKETVEMFVVLSRFTIADGMADAVQAAFAAPRLGSPQRDMVQPR